VPRDDISADWHFGTPIAIDSTPKCFTMEQLIGRFWTRGTPPGFNSWLSANFRPVALISTTIPKVFVHVGNANIQISKTGRGLCLRTSTWHRRIPPNRGREQPVKAFKVDWAVVRAHSRKLGEQGELFVLELERRRLHDAGGLDLERRIEWVSVAGDNAN
jgi:hypothetical protein